TVLALELSVQYLIKTGSGFRPEPLLNTYVHYLLVSSPATHISTVQYTELYQYLIPLFERLRKKQLIKSNGYFSVESRFLHEISSEDNKA
ncbi:hypothetical protein KW471_21660, partial [Vibrio fluvialis]|nr:hypothetical protein [Vibrio fluvialis]